MPPRAHGPRHRRGGGFRRLFASLFVGVPSLRTIIGDRLAGRRLGRDHPAGGRSGGMTWSRAHCRRSGLWRRRWFCHGYGFDGRNRLDWRCGRLCRDGSRFGSFCGLCGGGRSHRIGGGSVSGTGEKRQGGERRCETKKRHRTSPKDERRNFDRSTPNYARLRMEVPWPVHDIDVIIGTLRRNPMVQKTFIA
jgi:hypothetical protein